MGRLTLRNVFGRARCKKNGTKFCYETDECLYCKHNDEILEKLAHYEDLEEQGCRMVNIDKVVKQLEETAMKWESVHSQGGFVDLDKAIEIVKKGGAV